MRRALKLHPDGSCAALTSLTVEVARLSGGVLSLRYHLTGAIDRLRIPPPAQAARSDGLWRRTCFEAFIRAPGGEDYREFNFSPSGQWAAYRFERRREGMADLVMPAPAMEARRLPDRLTLDAVLDLAATPGLPVDRPWRLALSAVIEDIDGHISYWALAHPPGAPDFHHPDCFALEVVAPGRS